MYMRTKEEEMELCRLRKAMIYKLHLSTMIICLDTDVLLGEKTKEEAFDIIVKEDQKLCEEQYQAEKDLEKTLKGG